MFGASAPLDDVLVAAGGAGFTDVGVDLASVEAHVAAGGTVAGLAARMGELGLACSDVVVLALTPDRDVTLQRAWQLADLGTALGAPVCVAAVPEPVPWGDLVATTQACADILRPAGLRLAVEYLRYAALATLADTVALCDAVGWGRAGVLVDSFHFFRCGPDWSTLDRLDGGQVALVQLSDGVARPSGTPADESRNARLVPGDGVLPLASFLEALRRRAYDGPVSAEVLSSAVRAGEPGPFARRLHQAVADVLGSSAPTLLR